MLRASASAISKLCQSYFFAKHYFPDHQTILVLSGFALPGDF